jgi:NADPH:quinone reductase-like Zn-dependent oxidoreductase
MKGVVLPQYNKNIIRALLSLKPEEKVLRKPDKDEVVIKMHAAPCNPSDIAFMQGGYNIVKTLPSIMGFEGSGTVVDAGEEAKHLTGKKVSCFVQNDSDGTWADYLITKKENIIVLKDAMDMDQAACFTVNPFTAYGMMDIARVNESKAIVLNAAGGQVPQFMRAMAAEEGMESINIVRKEETAALLKEEGVKHVLIETEDDFAEKLKTMCVELKATTAFDAVGGALTGIMFNAMPTDSELILYGGLSNKPASGLDTLPLIFNQKTIYGFSLPDWKEELYDFEEISEHLQDLFIKGTLQTKIQGSTSIDKVVKGLRNYIANMSGGKVLIKPV